MLMALKPFEGESKVGMFINSCFSHCQSESQDTWFAPNSPRLHDKTIAKLVGDWFFERGAAQEVDCPYPCDSTCHNIIPSNQVRPLSFRASKPVTVDGADSLASASWLALLRSRACAPRHGWRWNFAMKTCVLPLKERKSCFMRQGRDQNVRKCAEGHLYKGYPLITTLVIIA